MSFDKAVGDVNSYRDTHIEALQNKKPNEWFTETVKDINKTFEYTTENEQWKQEWGAKTGNQAKIMTLGARLNWLASTLRDLRAQFLANAKGDNETDNTRCNTEFIRHEAELTGFYKERLKLFKDVTK